MLVFFLVVHVLCAFILRADPDEYQMLGAAFATLRGEVLFVDVWDNHGPAITWLLAGLLSLFGTESAGVILPLRAVFLAFSLATLAVLYHLARTEVFKDRVTAWLAVAGCVVSVPIAAKAMELRGDSPMNLLWVLVILLWVRAWRTGSPWMWFASGLILGSCFFFSVKTLILGFTIGLMFLMWFWMERRVRVIPVLLFGLGCAIPFITMLVILHLQGSLDAFLVDFFGKNLGREGPSGFARGFTRMRRSGRVWAYVTLFVLGYGWMVFRRPSAPPILRILWPAVFFLIFQYVFLLPTSWLQSLLPAMPLIALFFAWTVQDFLRDGRHFGPRASAVALFTLLLIMWMDVARLPKRVKDGGFLPGDIRHHAQLLAAIPPSEPVFSGFPMPYLRDHPLRVKSLVAVLRNLVNKDRLDLRVVETLAERDVRFVMYDSRVWDSPPATIKFLETHYLPLRHKHLMAAGKAVPAGADGTASAEIAIAGDYHWKTMGGTLRLNGEVAPNPVPLPDGTHEFSWEGTVPLVLCIAPPEDWSLRTGDFQGFMFLEEWKRSAEATWPMDEHDSRLQPMTP
jgi:hypothetical protein